MVINPGPNNRASRGLNLGDAVQNNVCRVVPFLFSALAIYRRCAKVITIQIVLFVMHGTAGADSCN